MIQILPACSITQSLPFSETGAPAHTGRSRPLYKSSVPIPAWRCEASKNGVMKSDWAIFIIAQDIAIFA